MGLKLFNTLSRSVQEFSPLDAAGKNVGMYCCGPTVYDYGHIGNFRTFVFSDLVRRHLEFKGYAVRHVMNITDVEDKIIKRVRETGKSLREYTGFYEQEFLKDLDELCCLRPHDLPHATDFIAEIISLIEKLLARGIAYLAADGSIYFSIDKYRGCGCHYGQLVKLNFDEMRVGERVSSDEYEKESLADFALWKARVPDDGAVFWDSPWGQGRPGWHIECSAMSMKLLGPSFDLHLGGEDLAFPHHEDEIAQSEGAGVQVDGQRFVKYWLHGAHLLVEGKKMSKSLGNFFTLRDLLAKGFTGREVRFLLLSAHYRETFNFTLQGIEAARTSLGRIDECLTKVSELAAKWATAESGLLPEGFASSLDDDLNVSKAWGVIFSWITALNRSMATNSLSPQTARRALDTWGQISKVFGVGAIVNASAAATGTSTAVANLSGIHVEEEKAPNEILALLDERQAARKAKDFKRSDAIRDELKAKGWVIEDTPKGPRLKKA